MGCGGWVGGANAALSIGAGGLWNLASLFCLARMLRAWLSPSPSTRRVLAWLLVKFPCLYAAVILLFKSGAISLISFGIGFTVVLVSAGAFLAIGASRLVVRPADGR